MTEPAAGARRALLSLLNGRDRLPAAQDPVWESCARLIERSSLSGTALTLLSSAGLLPELREGARAILEADLRRVRVEQTILVSRLEQLEACLRRAGEPFLVHKGMALAPLIYPRMEDRPMVDVDLVVRPSSLARICESLVEDGFVLPVATTQEFWRENFYDMPFESGTKPAGHFDLHWSLAQEERYHVGTEELFSRAVPYSIGPMRLLRMSNEDLLLSLMLHLGYHYFEAHLIWLYDMKRVIESWPIRWDILTSRARSWGMLTVVGLNLDYLEKIFPGLVPEEARRAAALALPRRALLRPLRSGDPLRLIRAEEHRLVQFVVGLLAIDRPGDAARFAAGKLRRTFQWRGRRPK